MPLFTKGFKLAAFNKNKFGRYLLYALGEIILVVAGILIALQINNANEARKQEKIIAGVLKSVSYDLELDTLSVGNVIRYFELREPISEAIIKDEYSLEDFKSCALCGTLISTYPPIRINDKGYLQLKSLIDTANEKDTLAVQIVQFYNGFIPILDEFGTQVKDFAIANIKDWRDEQPWFSKVSSGRVDERLYDYMNGQDYKNKVAYWNAIACKNYKTFLAAYKEQSTVILDRINSRFSEKSN